MSILLTHQILSDIDVQLNDNFDCVVCSQARAVAICAVCRDGYCGVHAWNGCKRCGPAPEEKRRRVYTRMELLRKSERVFSRTAIRNFLLHRRIEDLGLSNSVVEKVKRLGLNIQHVRDIFWLHPNYAVCQEGFGLRTHRELSTAIDALGFVWGNEFRKRLFWSKKNKSFAKRIRTLKG